MNLREAAQQVAQKATPREQLLKELMDSRVPKTEREHAAVREIERLRAALAEDAMQRLTDVQQEIEKTHTSMDNEYTPVQPVAYVTGYSKGYATVQPIDPCLLMPVGMALYRSPPTINEMETVEPVAWISEVVCVGPNYGVKRYDKLPVQSLQPGFYKHTPLYTAPPKRKPLTEEELVEAYCCVNDKEWAIGGMADARIFARAIERAHGIGGEK